MCNKCDSFNVKIITNKIQEKIRHFLRKYNTQTEFRLTIIIEVVI